MHEVLFFSWLGSSSIEGRSPSTILRVFWSAQNIFLPWETNEANGSPNVFSARIQHYIRVADNLLRLRPKGGDEAPRLPRPLFFCRFEAPSARGARFQTRDPKRNYGFAPCAWKRRQKNKGRGTRGNGGCTNWGACGSGLLHRDALPRSGFRT